MVEFELCIPQVPNSHKSPKPESEIGIWMQVLDAHSSRVSQAVDEGGRKMGV